MASPFDRSAWADGAHAPGVISAVTDLRSAGLTYEPFYGLREKPFSLTSDARFFYQSRSHAPAFDDLLNAIKRRESLTVLTGDIGTGKTTLCRAVLHALDHKTFSAFVPDPFASREDLLKVLLTDFGVAAVADVTSGRLRDASRTELTYLLHEFLGALAPQHAFTMVFVDEAQNLSVPLLEELRILSDADSQMQVVLVGQLELAERLRLPSMRQLDQRVSARCRLQPLDLAGVAGYISHRLHRAGGSADRVCFSGEAVEAIYERSAGVPRIINRLCDRALHAGYMRRAAVIDRDIVEAADTDPAAAAPMPLRVPRAESVQTPPVPAPPASAPLPAATVEPAAIDPVDVWLDSIEDPAPARIAAPVQSRREAPGRPASGARAEDRPRFRIRVGYVPRARAHAVPTHVPRKWTRRLEFLALTLVALLAVLIVTPSAWDAGSDTWTYVEEQFEAPPPPPAPPRPALHLPPALQLPYAIDPLGPDPF